MILSTKAKMAIARILNRVVVASRAAFGLSRQARVQRGGVHWNLDLQEGIDLSIYFLGSYEPRTARAIRKLTRQGNIALDIGANIGSHTLPLARQVGPQGRVIAFEPTDYAYSKLLANLKLNPSLASRVAAEQIMLTSDSDSSPPKTHFYSSWPLGDDQGLHQKHGGRLMPAVNARAETLDHYLKRTKVERVDLIKLDVDGHELPVLKGSLATLRQFHPPILMEVSPYTHDEERYSFEELIELLRQNDYRFRRLRSGRLVPMDANFLRRMIPSGGGINLLAEHHLE